MAEPLHFRTRAHLLVCTGPRCVRAGAQSLFSEAWATLESAGLAYYAEGGSVRLTESGCLGACDHGPTLACYARGGSGLIEAWYHHADLALVSEVARRAHLGEDLPGERRFGPRE